MKSKKAQEIIDNTSDKTKEEVKQFADKIMKQQTHRRVYGISVIEKLTELNNRII